MSRSVRDAAIGAICTLIASALLMLTTGAWASKESVAAHTQDMATLRADMRRMLDLLCTDRANAPQCKP